MEGKIEVRESYFKMPNGDVHMLRQIGDRYEWHGMVPVIFTEWANMASNWWRDRWMDSKWTPVFMQVGSPCALMKEGPKAIVRVG